MAVYVDAIVDYTLIARAKGLRWTHWCHLTADTQDELHAFAAQLGLRRAWFQNAGNYRWHYDVMPAKRALALRMGAVEIDRHGLAALMAKRREELAAKDTPPPSSDLRLPGPIGPNPPKETAVPTFPNRHDPRLIIKAAPDTDLYIGWSTICESPAGSWTRAEALRCGIDPARLERADKTGTSFIDSTEGAWDDAVMIAEQRGLLPRKDIAAYAELWLGGQQDKAFELLKPFEEDDDDE